MAQWTAQFNYADLQKLILDLTKTNTFKESPIQFKLLNADGSSIKAIG